METLLVPIDRDKAVDLYKNLMSGAYRLENEGFLESAAVYDAASYIQEALIAAGIDVK